MSPFEGKPPLGLGPGAQAAREPPMPLILR